MNARLRFGFFILLAGWGNLGAQQMVEPATFGSNTTRNWRKVVWQYIETPLARVHYPNEQRALGLQTAIYAEQALHELNAVAEYRPRDAYQVFVYTTPADYATAPFTPDAHPHEDLPRNTAHVLYTGDLHSFYPQLKSKIAEAYLQDLLFGNGTRRSFQNRALLHTPRWFYLGLAHYLGEGWTADDEAKLRSLGMAAQVGTVLNDQRGEAGRILRKSIWHLAARRYGERKIGELLYMVRLTRSVDAAIISVYGFSSASFSSYWEADLARYLAQSPPAVSGAAALPTGGGQLVNAALSPDGRHLAYVTESSGKFQLKVLELATNTVSNTGVQWGKRSPHPAHALAEVPITWGAESKVILLAVPTAPVQLMYYSIVSGNRKPVALNPRITAVNSVAWSPDRKRVALSAAVNGQSDLYYGPAFGNAFQQLTNDLYDDLAAVWAPDGNTLVFASNRDTVLRTTTRQPDRRFFRNRLDLYRLEIERGSITRLTATPLANEVPLQVPGEDVLLTTDANGLHNLAVLPAGQLAPQPLSDGPMGYRAVGTQKHRRVFFAREGTRNVAYLERASGLAVVAPTATPAVIDRRKEEEKAQAERAKALADSMDRARKAKEAAEQSKVDSSNTPRVRFYVFDEPDESTDADEKRKRRQEKRDQRLLFNPLARIQPFNLNALKPIGSGKDKFQLVLKDYHVRVGLDPLQGLYGEGGLEIGDFLQRHHLEARYRVYVDFRSNDLNLLYRNTRWPLQFGGVFERQSRDLDLEGDPRFFRFKTHRVGAFIGYPITRHQRVEFAGEYLRADRRELLQSLTDATADFDSTSGHALLQFRYIADNLERRYDFKYRGWQAKVEYLIARHTRTATGHFSTLRWDVRRFTPLIGGIVLATRFSGGVSRGNSPQTFFLGGLNDDVLRTLNNPEDIPVDADPAATYFSEFVTPMHGFNYNARNGRQFGLLNVEARLPIIRMFTNRLYDKRLYNFHWILFYDAGTAWDRGNPFSQKNPINISTITQPPFSIEVQSLQRPFIQGFGTGLELFVFGARVRFDLAWGLNDGDINGPVFSMTLGHRF